MIRVWEIDPPEGQEPIEWKLVTTEAVSNREQILKVVDSYRARWRIEEYFRALKTGCKYETRQLESFDTLQKALAILIPVAWRILLLRHLGRMEPNATAEIFFNKTQLKVLRFMYHKELPAQLTIEQAMLALASTAGHHKSNGDPGCQILWRGYTELLKFEKVWQKASKTCDR